MSLLGHDKRTVKSWKAAPEEMSLEATVKQHTMLNNILPRIHKDYIALAVQ